MRNYQHNSQSTMKPTHRVLGHALIAILALAIMYASVSVPLGAQSTNSTPSADLMQRLQVLNDAVAKTQSQIVESQRELDELKGQIAALKSQLVETHEANPASQPEAATETAPALATAVDELREHQAVQDAEIATHEQTKVESSSKYPVHLSGLILFNGFANTHAVDLPATPTVSMPGSGSTGASVRQTILGFDAKGPHIFGARSSADLHIDFAGTPQSYNGTNASGYGYNATDTLLRLRTAHARLDWDHTEAYFALDRPLLSPDSPTSLTAVAEPPLAWSGNLWAWNPQLGITQDIPTKSSLTLRFQGAFIDAADAPTTPASGTANSAEQSRWPGLEARIALLGTDTREGRNHLGVGGYFAPHLDPFGRRYDAWAATLDASYQLPARLTMTTNFYRGLALGGLGAGVFKDITYIPDADSNAYYSRPLEDVGGWAQLKEKLSERLELNAAFGTDQGFANVLRRYVAPSNTFLQNLARNTTYTGNVIYSPSAYLLFSFEYRYLMSSPVAGQTQSGNVLGVAAGYRF
jgi:hypothetical protein